MTDNVTNRVGYQLLSQPAGQDITVTYEDGTAFTARYCGSSSRRMDESGNPYIHIELSMITDLDATVTEANQ